MVDSDAPHPKPRKKEPAVSDSETFSKLGSMVINKSKYPPSTSYNIWIKEPSGFCSFKNFKEPVVFFIKELAVL